MKFYFKTSLFMLMAANINSVAQPIKMSISQTGRHIDISAGDKLVTSYRCYDDEKYPYFFPVNGPVSGGSLTAMRNSLYPHQSSLFLTCDKVNGANYWQDGLEKGQIHSTDARIVPGDEYHVIIEDECIWQVPGSEASVRDTRRMIFSAPSDKLYQMDFNIELEMLEDVVIDKSIHSLFCIRMAEDMSIRQGGDGCQ